MRFALPLFFSLLLGASYADKETVRAFLLIESAGSRCIHLDYPPTTLIEVTFTLDPSPVGVVTVQGPPEKSKWSNTFKKKVSAYKLGSKGICKAETPLSTT